MRNNYDIGAVRLLTMLVIGMIIGAFIGVMIHPVIWGFPWQIANKARIDVASGIVKCELITMVDRTTEWRCE